MHIPDSVLSPATCVVTGAAMLPVWALAGRRVRQSLGTRQIPLMALASAFCFTIMMFNIPALGGTTAHPVAGTLMAVLLGPWAAAIGISVALAIQALFFADGGLVAYGANCFTMAFVLPFVGYTVYSLMASRLRSRPISAAIGAFVGIVAASAMVALLLGIQPALYHDAAGRALYFPFGLKATLPAMLLTHLLVAGPAEAIVTAMAVSYLQTSGIRLYGADKESKSGNASIRWERIWIGLLALIALSPLGLLAKGEAWGEWDSQGLAEQLQKQEGRSYIPRKTAEAEAHAYRGVQGLQDYASDKGKLAYLGSGLLGAGVIVGLLLVAGRGLARGKTDADTEHKPPSDPPVPRSGSGELPDWMTRSSSGDAVSPPPGSSNPFLERSMAELSKNAATALNGERWVHLPGFLQKLDPRAKLTALLLLILVAAVLQNPVTLVLLYLATLLLGALSRLPLGLLIRRVWLSAPLFVGAVALPATLNVVTPGHIAILISSHPLVAVTWPGLLTAGLLVLRAACAVSLAALLTLTAPWNELLRALRALGTPRLFVLILAMTYRYLTALFQSAGEMFVARRSRTVGRLNNLRGRQFVGASIGALFSKTLALSEEVHSAMISRGFTGEMRTLSLWNWRKRDTLWLVGCAMVCLIALGGEHVHLR